MSKPATAATPPASEEPPRRRSVGRVLGITLFGIVAGVTVIALIAAGFVVWTIQRSFPQLEGTIAVEGIGEDVTVQRDALGIPTITASGTDDLFFAQG
jgi:penicillin amidase